VTSTLRDNVPRPRSVTYAISCFGVALVVGVAILAFPWGLPLQAFFTLLIIGFLIFNSARRRNWGRWTLTILTIAALTTTWPLLHYQLTYNLILGVATAAQISLELLGCCLLFLPQSGRWYGASRLP